MTTPTNQEMLSAVAWLSAFAGDKNTRFAALAPLAVVAMKNNDTAALTAILDAGASASPAIAQALEDDDPRFLPQLLRAATTNKHGVAHLRDLRAILKQCADAKALKCFEITAIMLRQENEAVLASPNNKNEHEDTLEKITWMSYEQRWLWASLAENKCQAVRAAVHAATSAGCSIDFSWTRPKDPIENPLILAIREGNLDLADELLSMGASVGRVALILAIGSRNNDLLALVIRHAGPDPINDGWAEAPLEAAIVAANLDAMRMLLAAGADPNGVSSNAETRRSGFSMLRVLLSCSRKAIAGCGSHEDMCSILLAAGADPALVSEGESPIEMTRPVPQRHCNTAELFALMEAELARRELVADLESCSAQPAPRSDVARPRL